MKKKTFRVTYEVIFTEKVFAENHCQDGTTYYADIPYQFQFYTHHEARIDQDDETFGHVHQIFGYVIDNTFTQILPLATNPVITKVEEVQQ